MNLWVSALRFYDILPKYIQTDGGVFYPTAFRKVFGTLYKDLKIENKKSFISKANKDNIAINQTSCLSLPKPKGIGPINPPTATLVFEVPSLALINIPKKTIIKPIIINNILSCQVNVA